MSAASPVPGALMFAEAAAAHEAVRKQLAAGERFADLGARLQGLKPRTVVTCARQFGSCRPAGSTAWPSVQPPRPEKPTPARLISLPCLEA